MGGFKRRAKASGLVLAFLIHPLRTHRPFSEEVKADDTATPDPEDKDVDQDEINKLLDTDLVSLLLQHEAHDMDSEPGASEGTRGVRC